jgi:hypothetical protein
MKFKEWLIQEIGTSTANIAGFRRMTLPLVRRMWPPSIATMFAQDPPGKRKKPYKQPQVEEGANELETAILQLLQQSPDGLSIGQMTKELGLDPSLTGKGHPNWTWNHGHFESPFNQALITMAKQGQVKMTDPQWGAPIFTLPPQSA